MPGGSKSVAAIFDYHPLTPDRWNDIAVLFGPKGASDGCWCMYWRVTAGDWKAGSGDERQAAFRDRVHAGPPPGILAYDGGRPVGWVQVTPRADIPRFNRTRTGKPASADADLDGIWALSCFFIARDRRHSGLMAELARAACRFAAERGAVAVEAAPIEPQRPLMWGEGFVGIASALCAAGFREIERRTPIRPLMRWTPEDRL